MRHIGTKRFCALNPISLITKEICNDFQYCIQKNVLHIWLSHIPEVYTTSQFFLSPTLLARKLTDQGERIQASSTDMPRLTKWTQHESLINKSVSFVQQWVWKGHSLVLWSSSDVHNNMTISQSFHPPHTRRNMTEISRVKLVWTGSSRNG